MTEAYRDRIRGSLEEDLDSLQYTYNQHFAVANFNRWLGRLIDFFIFTISGIAVITEVVSTLDEIALIILLLTVAGLSAFHRSARPGEQETKFRDSARAYHELFKRGRKFLQLDLSSSDLTDDEIRERYDELLAEYLELNRSMPDASSFWHKYMKYVKGEKQMEMEITTTEEKRRALNTNDQCENG